MVVDSTLEARLRAVWAALRGGPETLSELRSKAQALADEAPELHPAQVLVAQIAYLEGERDTVRARLTPVVDELPEYLPAALLLAHTTELAGEGAAAFHLYRRLVASSSVAGDRAARLFPVALEAESERISAMVEQGHVERAERALEALAGWAGESREVLELRRSLAVVLGDVGEELEILRRLIEVDPGDDARLERVAELEIALGDVRLGLAKLERLAKRRPGDTALVEKVERAKFLRRFELLPPFVQDTASKGVLDRADLATLLYWLAPTVRYARVSDPPIATDILDHPRREEILQVMNLELVPANETLHLFSPDEAATRVLTLEALMGLLRLAGVDHGCLDAVAVTASRLPGKRRLTCTRAAECGLLPEEADCLPEASVSGPDALDLFRRALDLLESQ